MFRTLLGESMIVLALFAAIPANAQTRGDLRLERLLRLRAVETTEAGVVWKSFEAPDCARCGGAKRVTCTACQSSRGESKFASRCATCKRRKTKPCGLCVGRGVARDPLIEMPCARCEGEGRVACRLCSGLGVIAVNTDQRPCHGCSRDGGHKCVVCAGKGAVKLDDAGAARLENADREQLDAARDALLPQLRAVDAERTNFDAAVRRRAKPEEFAAIHAAAMQAAAEAFGRFAKEPDVVASIVEGLKNKTGSRYFTLGPTVTPQRIYRESIDAAYATLRYQRNAIERCLSRVVADAERRAAVRR